MLATMICSKCGEPRWVSNREVTLPYVCPSCSDPAFSVVEMDIYQDMQPKADINTTEPTEEFSTVENTTLLIEDLERQLATTRDENRVLVELLTSTEKRAGEAEQQLEEAKECNARQAETIADQRSYIERREDEILAMNAQAGEQDVILAAIKALLRTL